MNKNIQLVEDLDIVASELSKSVFELNEKDILLTGGTGFFGPWLLYFLIHLKQKYSIHFNIFCLSRDSAAFLEMHPLIANDNNIFWKDQDLTQPFNIDFAPDYVFHMATDVKFENNDVCLNSFDAIISGTRNVLRFLGTKNKNVKLIFTSSGAVYGKQPVSVSHLAETDFSAPDSLNSHNFYSEGKRACELMCALYAKENSNFQFVSARCFAFSGAFLPLDKNFAIGNFVKDLIEGKDIIVLGNGMARRSYMYAADLVLWLTEILLRGKHGESYNVGSDQSISIGELAHLIAGLKNDIKVEIKGKVETNYKLEQYVPDVTKAKNQLGLKMYFSLESGIKKMIKFNELQNF